MHSLFRGHRFLFRASFSLRLDRVFVLAWVGWLIDFGALVALLGQRREWAPDTMNAISQGDTLGSATRGDEEEGAGRPTNESRDRR